MTKRVATGLPPTMFRNANGLRPRRRFMNRDAAIFLDHKTRRVDGTTGASTSGTRRCVCAHWTLMGSRAVNGHQRRKMMTAKSTGPVQGPLKNHRSLSQDAALDILLSPGPIAAPSRTRIRAIAPHNATGCRLIPIHRNARHRLRSRPPNPLQVHPLKPPRQRLVVVRDTLRRRALSAAASILRVPASTTECAHGL